MEDLIRKHITLKHHSGHMPGWYATGFKEASDAVTDAITDEMNDFCSAVLADNRPKTGEPWDTVRKWLLLARSQGSAVERRAIAVSHDGLRDFVKEIREVAGDGHRYQMTAEDCREIADWIDSLMVKE